jgi:hypothetical protein
LTLILFHLTIPLWYPCSHTLPAFSGQIMTLPVLESLLFTFSLP